jgi:hypothetical protein
MQGGERELVLGVDDKLMQETSRSIPRADVAELCVQCLGVSEAQNRYGTLQEDSYSDIQFNIRAPWVV